MDPLHPTKISSPSNPLTDSLGVKTKKEDRISTDQHITVESSATIEKQLQSSEKTTPIENTLTESLSSRLSVVSQKEFLDASKEALKATAEELPEQLFADNEKLLAFIQKAETPFNPQMKEWALNFGLLYSTYQRTKNSETKELIRFLMCNYLAKAAFLNASSKVGLNKEEEGFEGGMESEYQSLLQYGMLVFGGHYHRGVNSQIPIMSMIDNDLHAKFGAGNRESNMLLTDTMNIQKLYSVAFKPAPPLSKQEESIQFLVEQFESNLADFPGTHMKFPILVDITDQIGQSVITEHDPKKIEDYKDKQTIAKDQINSIVFKSVELLREKYPEREDIATLAANYIKTNMAIVSRATIDQNLALIDLHETIFSEEDFDKTGEIDPKYAFIFDDMRSAVRLERRHDLNIKIEEWANHSAINVGAVHLRQLVANTSEDPGKMAQECYGWSVDYAVRGQVDIFMYKNPDSFLQTNIFKTLKEMSLSKDKKIGQAQSFLAKATINMTATLLSKIRKEDWDAKQDDPIFRELTQTTLFRMSQHLANAIQQKNNASEFFKAMDCAHAELMTLLAIYTPFDPGSFEKTYGGYLKPLFPANLQPVVGLAKSAMNVFAGVNAAVIEEKKDPIRVCIEHSYYEELECLRETRTLLQILEDPTVKKVDLYTTEFYHNIDIDPQHGVYSKGRVIDDIKQIFAKKPQTNQLTVAIDATIDLTQSEDIKELFSTFAKEIEEGKLNIVVFRSGQKFDMLGLDNYFGSPFYIVNNGDQKWKAFNALKTDEVFKTDPLSQQFFCLMTETGPQLVDEYKKQIFDNTRAILNLTPSSLKSKRSKDVFIAKFEKDVKTPFIDIKIGFEDEGLSDDLRRWAQQRFMQLFVEKKKLVYVRGSFGFPQPNITWIPPKMRINPGIDPSDIVIYKQFFQEFEANVNKIKNTLKKEK